MASPNIIWTFEYDGELHDIQCDTREESQQAADDWWAHQWEDELRPGQSRSGECYIVSIDSNGKVSERHKWWLEFTAGDEFDEHRTY